MDGAGAVALSITRSPLRPRDRRRQIVSLSLVTAPLLGAYFFGQTGLRSPLVCPVHWLTGIPCPGCGMTRSFVAIARGQLPTALDYHPLGPLLFGGFLVWALQGAIALKTGYRVNLVVARPWRRRIQRVVMAMVIGWYGARLYLVWASGEATVAFARSPLGQWLNF